jgi:hypothetical protein
MCGSIFVCEGRSGIVFMRITESLRIPFAPSRLRVKQMALPYRGLLYAFLNYPVAALRSQERVMQIYGTAL